LKFSMIPFSRGPIFRTHKSKNWRQWSFSNRFRYASAFARSSGSSSSILPTTSSLEGTSDLFCKVSEQNPSGFSCCVTYDLQFFILEANVVTRAPRGT
jgi:hypothetical protein